MTKYFLYARKSTDEPDRQILSIEAQITELKEFAERENLNIIKEGGWGEGIFARPRFSATEFRASETGAPLNFVQILICLFLIIIAP